MPFADLPQQILLHFFRSMPFGPIGMAAGGIFGALVRGPSLRKSSHCALQKRCVYAEEMQKTLKQFSQMLIHVDKVGMLVGSEAQKNSVSGTGIAKHSGSWTHIFVSWLCMAHRSQKIESIRTRPSRQPSHV